MRHIATFKATSQGLVALMALLILGATSFFASPAHAGGDKKGVPTKLERKLSPLKRVPVILPRKVIEVSIPSTEGEGTVDDCKWVEMDDVTVVSSYKPPSLFVYGHTVEAACGPDVQVQGFFLGETPTQSIMTTGKSFVCGPNK